MTSVQIFPQIFAAICANFASMGMGSIIGYPSPAGVIFTSNETNSSLTLTFNENSWFSTISNLGALIGCPLAGLCINYFGRRGTLIYSSVPVVLGWVLIVVAQNFTMLIAGRFLTGFYCSVATLVVPTYIGEISSPHIRGILGSFLQITFFVGILVAYCSGAIFDSFRWIAVVCGILPCLCSVLMLLVHESPMYLLSKGKTLEAEKALKYFRGKNYEGISREMAAMKEFLEESKKRKATLGDLKKPYVLKPFIMALGLLVFQQLSGINAVLFNLSLIFRNVGSSLSGNTLSIIVSLVQFASCFVSTALVDKAGRKFLLIFSSVSMQFSLVSVGVFFYFNEHNKASIENLTWVLMVSMMVYLVGYSMGYGSIPWVMLGELFSPEIKELSASIATMVIWTISFVLCLVFQPLQDIIHDYGTFWLFAAFCFLNLVFVVTFVYETKGKTLQEINQHFGGSQTNPEYEIVKITPQ